MDFPEPAPPWTATRGGEGLDEIIFKFWKCSSSANVEEEDELDDILDKFWKCFFTEEDGLELGVGAEYVRSLLA